MNNNKLLIPVLTLIAVGLIICVYIQHQRMATMEEALKLINDKTDNNTLASRMLLSNMEQPLEQQERTPVGFKYGK